MSWIRKVSYAESNGELRAIYDRMAGEDGTIDNILTIHGQRPNTLKGHMALYKNVLHSRHNQLPKWKLELLGVYTSLLNGCHYCVNHHFEGLRGLLQDDVRAGAMREALAAASSEAEGTRGGTSQSTAPAAVPGATPESALATAFAAVFTAAERAMLAYARRLTLDPGAMEAADVDKLKSAGFSEGEVLEINQVVSYFAYVNRTALGLGVSLDGDKIGLSPGDSEDAENWRHGQPRE